MSKLKFASFISAISLMSVFFNDLIGVSQLPKSTVRLTSEPPAGQILPFEAEAASFLGSNQPQSPVRLTLSAVDASGQPLENAKIQLQVLTPPHNPWFSTDFPIVEGTELLNLEGNAPSGELPLQLALPIRGTYQLLVSVTPTVPNGFAPIQQTLTLSVPETPLKYRYAGILAVILLLLGLGGGLVIGGRQQIQPGEIAPQRVRLLLSGATVAVIASLVIVNVSAQFAESHAHGHEEHQLRMKQPAVLQSQGLELKLVGDLHATVGQPAKLAALVLDTETGQPVKDVNLSVKATPLDDDWIVFAYQSTPDSTGKLAWQQQFFDGAPHKVEVLVSPQPKALRQFKPFGVAQEIEVEAVATPLRVRLISLAYFTSIFGLGLALGLWQQQRRLRRSYKNSFIQ